MTTGARDVRFPKGDLGLLAAIIVVGLWPFFALWRGEAPPSWELGAGTVLVLLGALALLRAAKPARELEGAR